MPVQKTITLYRYAELSESAKEKARMDFTERVYWPEEVEPEIENWRELAGKLGFTIDHNGGPWWDVYRGDFYFSGDFQRPDDAELDALAKEWGEGNKEVCNLIAEVRAIRPGFWGGVGKRGVERSDIDQDDPELVELESGDPDVWQARKDAIEEEEEPKLKDALSSLCALGLAWIQAQIEYLESEEYMAETAEANGWLFHENGAFWGTE